MNLRLDLTDLRLFVNVVNNGSITAGAAATHLALASASARMAGLELALDAPLLLRSRRGVQPTAAGQRLLVHASAVLQQAELLRADLEAHATRYQGLVRLVGNSAALREYVPDALGDFLVEHPQVNVKLAEALGGAAVASVVAGDADLAIVTDTTELHGLHSVAIRRAGFAIITARGHPIAAAAEGRTMTMASVDAADVVGLSEGSPLQDTWEQRALQRGKRLNYRVRVASFDAQARLVERGVGVALLPAPAARRLALRWAIDVIRMADPYLNRRLLLCALEFNALSTPARALVARLREG